MRREHATIGRRTISYLTSPPATPGTRQHPLRHVLFLQTAAGVHAHMDRHRVLLKPKFDLVQRTLAEQLGDRGVATWTVPEGGYFVTLDGLAGCASGVVSLAAGAGIALTAAGAPFPYGKDPDDRVIRLAPTYPPISELAQALEGLVLCVKLAAIERLLDAPLRT